MSVILILYYHLAMILQYDFLPAKLEHVKSYLINNITSLRSSKKGKLLCPTTFHH